MIDRITVTDRVRAHLSTHFSPELPGSKFFSDSPEAVIESAMRLCPEKFREAVADPDGRYRLSVVFPEPIGISNVVRVSDLNPDERNNIRIVDRNGIPVRALRTDRRIPTCECQLVVSSDMQLITMYPGEFAPPLPSSPDEPSEFWDSHVFILS